MTPPLVDHAHTDSYIVIGCNLVQPRIKMNMFISGRTVTSQLHHSRSRNCEHEIARCCMTLHGCCNRRHIAVSMCQDLDLDNWIDK